MAILIPEDIEKFTTDGERQVYQFLRSVAKPDLDYIVWYSPDIQGREPDFILYNDAVGLIILEVKDWSLEQIFEADRKQFRLFLNGREESRKNPMQQARDYFFACMDALKKDGRLMSADHGQQGNPRVPISCGVIFPNINKMEFEEQALGTVLEFDKVLFWDDLHPESPLSQDTTGKVFHDLLLNKFEPRFPCQLTGKEKGNYSAVPIFVRFGRLMYKIVHYGDQPERTWALLNSYGSEFSHILWGMLNSYRKSIFKTGHFSCSPD